ncbi:DUF3570 domain-containing protein [Teredinibacter turnerae]|uniref:DUF3570 domain-containing protein n=1 Tax=Teredinibacter turnerae TaxID=2426 RepID=UPI0003789A5B|nr:DUF3570 domain-containing protein [Teredinibacter turnerae]
MKKLTAYSLPSALVFVLASWSASLFAAVLPEDRTDVLYHRFEGGGVTIDGPSVLVRKGVAEKVSVWANYYVDFVSSASLDVITQGSAYTEERTETSTGFDYLRDRTIMSLSYTNSSESDYEAETFGLGLSQDFFGDLSTISLGYSQGNDTVRQNGSPDVQEPAQHQRFSIGWTQVLTKNWIVAVNSETVIDEGRLDNPYRGARYLGTDGAQQLFQPEKYPTTRNSDAFAIRSMVYLPYRASVRAEARIFQDSWGVKSTNYELRYVHPYKDSWIFEAKYRMYDQSKGADFYADLFPYSDPDRLDFRGRDKELAVFSNTAFGLGASYEFKAGWLSFFDKTTVNLYWDSIAFDYENYRDNKPENTEAFGTGNEPLYSFNANVVRFFLSAWY